MVDPRNAGEFGRQPPAPHSFYGNLIQRPGNPTVRHMPPPDYPAPPNDYPHGSRLADAEYQRNFAAPNYNEPNGAEAGFRAPTPPMHPLSNNYWNSQPIDAATSGSMLDRKGALPEASGRDTPEAGPSHTQNAPPPPRSETASTGAETERSDSAFPSRSNSPYQGPVGPSHDYGDYNQQTGLP